MKPKDLKGKEISVAYSSFNYEIENELSRHTIEMVDCDADTFGKKIWFIYADEDKEFVLNDNEFKYLLNGDPAKIGGDYDAMLYIELCK